jgi:predicted MPP superfamily phosphohydrolase
MALETFITRFAFAITLWLIAHAYIGFRLLKPARGRARWWLALFLLAIIVLPPLTLWLDRNQVVFGLKDALRWVGFASIGFSALVAFAFAVDDVVRLASRIGARFGERQRAPVDRDRRRFLRNSMNLGVVAAAGSVAGVGAGVSQSAPKVHETAIPIPGLPPDLEGFRIVQITDVHVGPTIRRDYAEALARAANALKPDLIAVTGDLVDGLVSERGDDVAPLRDLAAPHGVYFVTGNHEYYWDLHRWLETLRGFGWKVLVNQHEVVQRGAGKLLIAGVPDHRAGRYEAAHRSDPAKAREGAPPCDASILLAHRPISVFEAAKARYDLQISGHTHGGQFFPVSLLVGFFEPYVSGLHRHDGTWIYVSRGAGYWGPPLRLGVPKEIAVLKLVKA